RRIEDHDVDGFAADERLQFLPGGSDQQLSLIREDVLDMGDELGGQERRNTHESTGRILGNWGENLVSGRGGDKKSAVGDIKQTFSDKKTTFRARPKTVRCSGNPYPGLHPPLLIRRYPNDSPSPSHRHQR